MARKLFLLISLILLALAGCAEAPATAVLPTTNLITQESTAVLPEQPLSPSPDDPLLTPAYPPPSPPPQPTFPYPGPTPNPFATRRVLPTPTPTVAVNPVKNCDLSPSFSRCGGVPLTGELAYFQESGQLTVLILDAETAWVSTQINLRDVAWSPAGNRLLVHDENLANTYFYHQDGRLLHSETTGWVSWGQTDNHIRAGSYLWNEDYSISVHISRPPTDTVAQINFTDGTPPKEWPVDVSGYPYGAFVLDWVPQMEWVLLGYGHGGVATNMALGYRLMALNVRTGEILDSGLSTPGIEQIDWHPFEPGLLLTTDLRGADVGGLGAMVTWKVLENRVTYPSISTRMVRSPVWSPDGRYIAYSTYDLSGNIQLMVLDTETGTVETRALNGTWPAWSRNSSMIFYLETVSGSESALIRAVEREQGEPLTVAVGQLPHCPGLCQPRTVFDYTP